MVKGKLLITVNVLKSSISVLKKMLGFLGLEFTKPCQNSKQGRHCEGAD